MPPATYRTGTRAWLRGWQRAWQRERCWLAVATGACAALAGCGHLWQVSTLPAAAPPRDVYACAIAQATRLGYKVVSDTAHREQRDLEASKAFEHPGPETTEYSRKDLLSVIVTSKGSDSVSTMRVTAGSMSRQETRRGPTDVTEPATVDVRADADTVIARCRVAAPPTT